MNGISFKQIIQTQPATQDDLNETSRPANKKGSFFRMLNDSLIVKELKDSSTLKESNKKELFGELFAGKELKVSGFLKEGENKALLGDLLTGKKLEIPDFLKESELEELIVLHKLISQLVDEHEFMANELVLADDVFANPLVEDLLEQLSYQLQDELEALFAVNDSFKGLIEQGEGYLTDPVQLLAVVIGLAHVQSQDNPETKVNSQVQAETLGKSETKVNSQVKAETLGKSETKVNSQVQAETLSKSETKVETQVQTQTQVNPETKVELHVQTQANSGIESVGKTPNQAVEKLQVQLEQLLALLTKNEQVPSKNEKMKARDFHEIVKQLTTSLQSMATKERQKLTDSFQTQKQDGKEAQFILSAFSRMISKQSTKVNQGIVLPPAQAQLNSVQQYVIHVGENRGGQSNSEQFLRQFQNILGRSTLAQFPNGVNQLSIKLYPEHLGRLDVKLTQQNGVIIAQLMTSTNAAKKAVESQIHQLRQAFVAQNIPVDKIEISSQQQSQEQSDKENQEEKKENKPNHEQQQTQNDGDEEVNFEDILKESFSAKV